MNEGENHPRLLRKHTEIIKEDHIIRVLQNAAKKRGHIERFSEKHCINTSFQWLNAANCNVDLCRLLLLGSFDSSCFPIAYALTSFAPILV